MPRRISLTRLFARLPHSQLAAITLALATAASSAALHAQTDVPAAPAAPQQAPGADVSPAFPKPDPADFTATSPTKEQVMSFLQAAWGYDTNRVFQVQRIVKTSVPGISNVLVAVGEKGNKQVQALQFFALPDGKHIIAQGEILPFGDNPYAENRAMLQQRATGPYKGSADKKLELVEFADFQCPHCKDAQANMDKLAADFPNAHIVFQNFPLVKIHPEAMLAAEYGHCVAKLGGNDAFFKYANATFDGQAGLATTDGAQLTLNSAVTASGQDPTKIAACAKDPATETAVKADIQLAEDLAVNQTPMLAINGRLIPLGGLDYETLKKIVAYHASIDAK
jgi:protein-disulfide isomerase